MDHAMRHCLQRLGGAAAVRTVARAARTPRRGEGRQAKLPSTNGQFLVGAMAYHDSVAFLACVENGVPQWVGAQKAGATPQELADRFGLTLRGASALMVTLCRMGVLRVAKDDPISVDVIRYAATPAAKHFLGDDAAPQSTKVFASSFVTHFFDPKAMWEACRTDGKDLMTEHTDQTDEAAESNARHFMRHMDSQSWSCAEAFPTVLGLKGKKPVRMLDVGGGSAVYSIAAAKANPNLTGKVLELAQIKPITEEYIAEAGVAGQLSVVAGDFFSKAPFPDTDLVLFANIFHDWADDVVAHLIEQTFRCLAPGGRIAVSELLLADDVRSSPAASTSMNVIVVPWTKGRQYRSKELHARLRAAGFVKPRTHCLVDDYSIVVAEKPLRPRKAKGPRAASA